MEEKSWKSMSQYQRDIVDLIGVNFEEISTTNLRLILDKCYKFLPKLLDKSISMTMEEAQEYLKNELGMRDAAADEAEVARQKRMKELECQAFRKSYMIRRYGRTAVRYRLAHGYSTIKQLMPPVIAPEDEEQLLTTVKKVFPFSLLDESKKNILIHAMNKLSVDPGEFLIKTGDFVDNFYYVQSGLFGSVDVGECCIVTEYFKSGQYIGAENLFFGNIWEKTIKCLDAAEIWVLGSKTYHSLCKWGLEEMYLFLECCISKTPALKKNKASVLANAMENIHIKADTDVLATTPHCALYIVFKGEVHVIEVNKRDDEFRRTCYRGGTFGRDRLWTKRFARLQSAVTVTDSTLYYLTSEAFSRLFDVLDLYKKSHIEIDHDDLFYLTL